MRLRLLSTTLSFSLFHILFIAPVSFGANFDKYINNYKRPNKIPYPSDNKYTKNKEELGKMLFFDPRLSKSDWISCASCHNPALSWGDGLPKGIGHGMNPVGRRTPTILNLAWGELMFWDGRSDSLEDQALGPIQAPGEMNLPHDKMIKKLKLIRGYNNLFEKAYPGKGISTDTVAKAIATFERTVISDKSPFDKWVEGNKKAISDSAKRGFVLFNEKAMCAECHSGWRFTDDSFHDIGIAGSDKGRGKVLDVKSLDFAFKTPTLRNVDHRAPYMHDGSEKTLESVIDLYDLGGRVKRKTVSDKIVPLKLTKKEKVDLIAFLHTLTSNDKPILAPMLPR